MKLLGKFHMRGWQLSQRVSVCGVLKLFRPVWDHGCLFCSRMSLRLDKTTRLLPRPRLWDSSVLIFNYCQMDRNSGEEEEKRPKARLCGKICSGWSTARSAATTTGDEAVTSLAPVQGASSRRKTMSRTVWRQRMFELRLGFPNSIYTVSQSL